MFFSGLLKSEKNTVFLFPDYPNPKKSCIFFSGLPKTDKKISFRTTIIWKKTETPPKRKTEKIETKSESKSGPKTKKKKIRKKINPEKNRKLIRNKIATLNTTITLVYPFAIFVHFWAIFCPINS